MNKTVASVIDDINEWENPRGGSVFYVTAIFTDESVGSVGRKDHDAALEVQGLLRESIGEELDFTLEPGGKTKTGREKFKIKGFGTPGGAATYTAPGVGAASSAGGPAQANPAPAPTTNTEASIRAAVALKAAVEWLAGTRSIPDTLLVADAFDEWLQRKASEPASSEYRQVEDDSPSHAEQPAGAGSDDSSAGVFESSLSAPADSAVEGAGEGEASAPTPHQHDWQPHPNLRNWLKCECGEARKKDGYSGS